MLSQSPSQWKPRSLKHLLKACLVTAMLLVSAGCQWSPPTQAPGVSNAAGPRHTPEFSEEPRGSATPTSTPPQAPSQTSTTTPTQTASATRTPRILETVWVSGSPTPEDSYAVIGLSAEGRPLEVYTFGSGADQRLIIAGIHGGYEWNSTKLADELIAYLQANPQALPAGKTLYILRNLNPDGEARAHGPDGRANANGVDLNRNFPANWEKNYRRSGCWQERPMTAGLAPASEPETQAVIAFVAGHPGLQAAISYHSAALGIFPGGLPPNQNAINLAETLAAVSGYPYPPMDTGCIYTGEMVNWLAIQGIPSVDIELTNHRDTDFETNLKVLDAFLSWEPAHPAGGD